MKKVLLLVLLVNAGLAAFSQKDFRINLYSAYVFDDSYDEAVDANAYYSGKIKAVFSCKIVE